MRAIRLYNTLTRSIEEFIPLHDAQVGFYVCGPTVYDLIHIGNARVFVLFDCLRRFFELSGYQVIYVQNFTDIDDKIIIRAGQQGEDPKALAQRYIEEYYIDADHLGVKRATYHPRATEHIGDIISLIGRLEEKGYTYGVAGDVLFDTSRQEGYGKLSRKNLDELREGARVEARYRKKSPADFVLWKAAKPGEPSWPSPWGEGRPGWHIECSAMAERYLGDTVDIHAGGIDLVFPHHENEIVQSEAATDKPFVRYWLHNGYLNINHEKMSKSLGNIVSVRKLSEQWKPEVLRSVLLSTHYRHPINIDETVLRSTQRFVERLENLLRNLRFIRKLGQVTVDDDDRDWEFQESVDIFDQRLVEALADDFNTPQALGVFNEFMKQANNYLEPKRGTWSETSLSLIQSFLDRVHGILGLVPPVPSGEREQDVLRLVHGRTEAREARQWPEADRLRDEIASLGYIVEDTPLGPRWYRAVEESVDEAD